MGVYDFNISSFNIDSIIAALRKDLQDIVVNSQTNIAEIKTKIAEDEALLKRLKNAVDNLPDYTNQYNELKDEITKLNLALDELIKHPIVLDNIDVRGASGLISEVQKINGQFIYANHAVNDAQGNNIVDTYATKDELVQNISATYNIIDIVSGNLSINIEQEIQRATEEENLIKEMITSASGDFSGDISALDNYIDLAIDSLFDTISSTSGNINQRIDDLSDTINDLSATIDNELTTTSGNLIEIINNNKNDQFAINNYFSGAIDYISGNLVTSASNLLDYTDTLINETYDVISSISGTLNEKISSSAEQLSNDISDLADNLSKEIDNRTSADNILQDNINVLQGQIDTIEATQNVIDLVGTYNDLQNYDTTNVKVHDKIQVITDSTSGDQSTIYSWENGAWSGIGMFGPYYTKAETEGLITSTRNDFTSALNTETSARTDVDTLLSGRIDNLESTKQNNLSAGDGIDITNDVVSHSIKVIENNNEEDTVEGTVFTVYLKNNHYKIITFDKTITSIKFIIESSTNNVLQETGFEFTCPDESVLEEINFEVKDNPNKKIYTILPDSYTGLNIYQGTIVNYKCTIGEYEVEN